MACENLALTEAGWLQGWSSYVAKLFSISCGAYQANESNFQLLNPLIFAK